MSVRNAIIMAAGTSSRFVPLSVERPKGLLEVKGEILIERQICQLLEAGIRDITIVVGYKAEMFTYLKDKYCVNVVMNEDYARFNNTSSIIKVIDKLDNTFVCSSDNYFPENVFLPQSEESYYSARYAHGKTNEYCLTTDIADYITKVEVGGHDSWYMVGHVFFNHSFSEKFREIMEVEYENDETRKGYWEDVYIKYIDQLPPMKINRYKENEIQEFDSLDELRIFDLSYIDNTRSSVVVDICKKLDTTESNVHGFENIKHEGDGLLFYFYVNDEKYLYNSEYEALIKKV